MLGFLQWLLNAAPETKEIFSDILLSYGLVGGVVVGFGLQFLGEIVFFLHNAVLGFVGNVGAASRSRSVYLAWISLGGLVGSSCL
jgi:hypothetical protein